MSNVGDRRNARSDWDAGGAMGDVIAELHKEGHVTDQHYVTAMRFLQDLRRSHGTSNGIVGQLAERVDASTRERIAPPGGGDPDSFARVSKVFHRLPSHQRKLFNWLVVRRELPRGGLSDWGRQASGYKTNKTTRAFATGVIVAFLASLDEAYG